MSDAAGPTRVRAAPTRRAAEEWALVLSAEGLAPELRHADGGFELHVAEADVPRATRALEAWERENRDRPAPPAAEPPIGLAAQAGGWLFATALLASFAVTGPRRAVAWFERGTADADRIVAGELWRCATALTLHADFGHVAANALFGGLFLAALGGALGPGLAFGLSVTAGILGNGANALLHASEAGAHLSVGASTAVFGAVGLLAGRAGARGHGAGRRGPRLWIPAAAGLALIAMLGTGERSDVSAHLFGFLAGLALGLPAGRLWPRPPGVPTQLAAALGGAAALLTAWLRALA